MNCSPSAAPTRACSTFRQNHIDETDPIIVEEYSRAPVRLAFGYTLIAVAGFALLAFVVTSRVYLQVDLEITRAVQAFRSPLLDISMQLIGLPGSPPQTLILNALLVLIFFMFRSTPEALTLLVFIPTFGTISTWIRCGIDRPRPTPDLVFVMDLLKDRSCSFPSGHTLNFLAALGFLMYVGFTRLAPSWHRNILIALYGLYVVLMGISRIYVGDHWPTDVLGGLILGSIFLVWMIVFYEWVKGRLLQFDTRQGQDIMEEQDRVP